MPTVIQNKWDGGSAEDIRTTNTNQSEKSQNFDIFTEPYRLNPYPDSIAETADVAMDDSEISDVVVSTISGTDYITGIGYESAGSTAMTFYTKTSITGTFVKQASATGNSFVKGSGVTYKGLAFGVDDNGSGTYRLIRFNSAGSTTTIGSISATSGKVVKCFVHPEDNVLYVVISNVIATWNGSTFTTYTSILPLNYSATSLTNYGGYLAITMNSDQGANKPTCFLWGRDGTINTLQASVPLGEGYVGLVENLNNNLIFVMSPYSGFNTDIQNKIIVKGYSGGSVDTLAEVLDNSTLSIGQVQTYKAKKNNRVYFGFRNSDCVWTFGKNKEGTYVLTQDRFSTNGTQISGNPSNQTFFVSIIGDVMWVGGSNQSGVYTLMRSKIVSGEGLTYTGTSTYKTTINPSMPIADRYKSKQLQAFRLSYTGTASGTLTLKYAVDGSTMTTAVSLSTSSGEDTIEATNQEDGSPFDIKEGRELQFQIESTGGVKIKEFAYRYDIKETTI